MDITGLEKFVRKHHDLLVKFGQINALLDELLKGKYMSVDAYVRDFNQLCKQTRLAQQLLKNPKFKEYILLNDATLFYNIQSVMLALQVFENLLLNLSYTDKNQ